MLAGCDDVFLQFMQSGEFIPTLAITLGCLTGMIAIIGGTITSVVRSRTREQTKREIAAYVAEGSIDPDKAVAMLNAGMSGCEINDDSIKIT